MVVGDHLGELVAMNLLAYLIIMNEPSVAWYGVTPYQ
jgi:hypothetical protein